MQCHKLPRGLTLVEILGALVILSTLFVGIMLVKGRAVHQLYSAEAKAAALDVADALVTKWWANPEKFPRNTRGTVESNPNFGWRTKVVSNDSLFRLGAQQVHIEIVDAASGEQVLVGLDVVLPDPDRPLPEPPSTQEGK